jgi:hypothetical protein
MAADQSGRDARLDDGCFGGYYASHKPRQAVDKRHASGTIAELERVPDRSPEMVGALAAALERWPHRESEPPSWWAGTLWAYELVRGKPTAAAVEVALYELRRAA